MLGVRNACCGVKCYSASCVCCRGHDPTHSHMWHLHSGCMPEHCACKATESAFADKQHDKMHRVPHHITIAFLATFLTIWIKDVTYAKKKQNRRISIRGHAAPNRSLITDEYDSQTDKRKSC